LTLRFVEELGFGSFYIHPGNLKEEVGHPLGKRG
jgi:hypothetical protein